jgi:thiol-disulfide isomerase/thioredoxin
MLLLALACVSGDTGWGAGGRSTPPSGEVTGGSDDPGSDSDEPEVLDADGDGLSDDEEAGLGTDPNSEDSDEDGHADGDEISAGSDPLVCWSVPEGSWPDCRAKAEADGLQGEGWRKGKVMPNWTATDQYGNPIEAWQLYGMVVVLDISAGWCGPCNQAAQGAEDWYQGKKDEGVIEVHLMVDDWYGNGASQDFLEEWASEYGLTFPVVMDSSNTAYSNLYNEGYIEGIPAYFIYDREMVLQETWSGYAGESYLSLAVARYK